MELDYFYCNCCGYESNNVDVNYMYAVANGDICECPECGKEVLVSSDWKKTEE